MDREAPGQLHPVPTGIHRQDRNGPASAGEHRATTAGKLQQRERWQPLLERWEELERTGIKGKAREEMICEEFPIGRASIASTLTKARKARKEANAMMSSLGKVAPC